MGKRLTITRIIIGIILILIGMFYLFFPHSIHMTVKLDFGLQHYHHILLGGFLLVIGSAMSLDGKRLRKGIFVRGWRRRFGLTLTLYILTFGLLYLWFNSGFELLAGDVNKIKIVMFYISSIGLSIALFIGIITSARIFGLTSTRY